jgi:sarcosine oxidase gamma subunit
MRLHVCLFATIVFASAAAAQTPPRDRAAPAAATATIRGRVTDLETGLPLAGAIVVAAERSGVRSLGGQRSMQSGTGADGRYVIADLAPGEYFVIASPPEQTATHVARAFGATLPYQMGMLGLSGGVELKAGEVRDGVDLALMPARAIEGYVVNESGEPLAEVMVTAERPDLPGQGGAMAGGVTDDRGVFRVFGLPSGRYRICATPSGGGSFSGGGTLDARPVRTCHPAAVIDQSADLVTLTNADVSGVVIHLQRAGTFTASGRVVDESGSIAADAHVTVSRLLPQGGASVPVETNSGVFTARGLTPGEYVIRVTARHATGAGEPAPRVEGYSPLRVESGDVSGLTVTVSPGASVKGRVVVEGGSRPAGRLIVKMRRAMDAQRIYQSMPAGASVREDGTFELHRLFGPQAFGVEPLPAGWVVEAVRYRGADIVDVPVELATVTDPKELEIVLTRRSAQLSVRVVDEQGRPAVGQVVLMPADPRRWRAGIVTREGLLSQERELPSLRAGEYLAAALPVEDLMRGLLIDPALPASIAKVAQRISLRSGEHAKMDLRVTPLPRAVR